MPAILRICEQAILLDHGRVVAHGATQQVVRSYLESDLGRTAERTWENSAQAPGDEVARLKSVRVVQGAARSTEEVDIGEPVDIEVEYWSESPGGLRPSTNLHFFNDEGVCLFVTNDWNDRAAWSQPRHRGIVRARCRIPGHFLAEGRIVVTVAVSTYGPVKVHVLERDAVAFQVVDRTDGSGVRGEYASDWPGVVRPMLEWHVQLPKRGAGA
jgi:lipopolysaccharide transport system ATP-binding protein